MSDRKNEVAGDAPVEEADLPEYVRRGVARLRPRLWLTGWDCRACIVDGVDAPAVLFGFSSATGTVVEFGVPLTEALWLELGSNPDGEFAQKVKVGFQKAEAHYADGTIDTIADEVTP